MPVKIIARDRQAAKQDEMVFIVTPRAFPLA
jgi:hypothetical protein